MKKQSLLEDPFVENENMDIDEKVELKEVLPDEIVQAKMAVKGKLDKISDQLMKQI